jgi:hypothetical protein
MHVITYDHYIHAPELSLLGNNHSETLGIVFRTTLWNMLLYSYAI